MANLATQEISNAGIWPVYGGASAGGDKFDPDEETFLHVKNGAGGSPATVTVVTPGTSVGTGGLAIEDVVVSVPVAQDRMIGPFPAGIFGNPADSGKASVTYTGTALLVVAALRLRRPT